MSNVLLAYATNSGSTEEVARAVAEELGKNGNQVDVRQLDDVGSLEAYQLVVIGAPLIIGWHRSALNFVKKHRAILARVRVAYFFTGMSLTDTSESKLGPIPIYVDPELAKPPKKPGHLSLKENYARVSNYLAPLLRAAPQIKPASVAFFGGKLELFRLNFLQMLFVMVIIQAQPGDHRNWAAIREWAGGLRATLLETAS